MKPLPADLAALRPRNAAGARALLLAVAMTLAGLALALGGGWLAWCVGQVLLAVAFLQWFALLHEAGHRTLFASRAANRVAGHVAGFFALIPFHNWARIHARHHRFTGWQDLDATTALLTPRPRGRLECALVDAAWASGLPLFSTLYRVQNFWNVRRIARYLPGARDVRLAWINVGLLAAAYVALGALAGPVALALAVGPALLASLAMQDVILLSQHTHMPRHLSGGEAVKPFAPAEQERFTRSLLLPRWLAFLMLNFDRHELHHLYVRVPGYDLGRIAYQPPNEVGWFAWWREAKRLSGTQFLFGRREETGLMR